MMKNILRTNIIGLIIAIGFTVLCVSAQTAPGDFPNITIRNFGRMDANYYRGAQPKQEDYQALKDLGINTFIDLQKKPTKYEKLVVESLGLKYINIPMADDVYPAEAAIAEFLKNINDPANGVMYVHCKGGRHRTGVTGAVYRFTKYGWDYAKVMKEMENYNFDTSYGRDAMKKFVIDYAAKTNHLGSALTTSK